MSDPVRTKDGIFDNGIYIIDWCEVVGDKEYPQRDVAQCQIDSAGEIAWMIMGQEWHGVYHDMNKVKVLAYIDTINCTCVQHKEPQS